MINVKEAIEILKTERGVAELEISNGHGNENFRRFIKATDIAIEACERQDAKKPRIRAMPGFDMEIASHLVCPSCEQPVINYWNRKINPPNCMMCGQKLDWEETK